MGYRMWCTRDVPPGKGSTVTSSFGGLSVEKLSLASFPRRPAQGILIAFAFLLTGPARVHAQNPPTSAPARAANPGLYPFGYDSPEHQSVDVQKLIELTQWIKQSPAPILSVLI